MYRGFYLWATGRQLDSRNPTVHYLRRGRPAVPWTRGLTLSGIKVIAAAQIMHAIRKPTAAEWTVCIAQRAPRSLALITAAILTT